MTIHGPLFSAHAESQSNDQFALQNKKLLRINMNYGPVLAAAGSMVAYQGNVAFKNRGSGGVGKMLKKAVSGEGVNMMECAEAGELFVAANASEIQVMYLENDEISVNGSNILAFSSSIEWDIRRLQGGSAFAGGLFNVHLRGTGYVAVTTNGEPVALDVGSQPTFGDPQACVLWTAGVTMNLKMDTGGIASLVRGGTGETWQMAFGGQGYVVVQPSEVPPTAVGAV